MIEIFLIGAFSCLVAAGIYVGVIAGATWLNAILYTMIAGLSFFAFQGSPVVITAIAAAASLIVAIAFSHS